MFLIIMIVSVLFVYFGGLLLLNMWILNLCFLFLWFKGFVLVIRLFFFSLNFVLLFLIFMKVNGFLLLGLLWLWGCKKMIVVFMVVNLLIEIVKFVLVNLGGLLFRLLMLSLIWVFVDKGGIFLFWVCIVRVYWEIDLWLICVLMLIMLVMLLILNLFVLFFFMME